MSAFDAGVRDGMEKAAAWNPFRRVNLASEKWMADRFQEGLERTLTSDNANRMIENTFKKSWKPILGASLLAGAGIGLGTGVGYRLSQVGKSGVDSGPGVQGRMTYPAYQLPPMMITTPPSQGVRGYEGRLRRRSS